MCDLGRVRLCALLCLAAVASPAFSAVSWLDEMAELDVRVQLTQKAEELNNLLENAENRRLRMRAAKYPSIVAIVGMRGQYTARLRFADGRVQSFREGAEIGSDMRIARILANAVVVSESVASKRGAPTRVETPLPFHLAPAGGVGGGTTATAAQAPSSATPGVPRPAGTP